LTGERQQAVGSKRRTTDYGTTDDKKAESMAPSGKGVGGVGLTSNNASFRVR